MSLGLKDWWAYRHVNGGLQVKRFFSKQDTEEARESDFVKAVIGPFKSADRESAIVEARKRLP